MTPSVRHREFLWLLGGIGALLVLALAALLVVVTLYHPAPVGGHPTATPTATHSR